MFDRFNEHARRAIFFARYEAGSLGSRFIDTEHLLLGVLREDRVLSTRLPAGSGEKIRQRIFSGVSGREKISGSVGANSDSEAGVECVTAVAIAVRRHFRRNSGSRRQIHAATSRLCISWRICSVLTELVARYVKHCGETTTAIVS